MQTSNPGCWLEDGPTPPSSGEWASLYNHTAQINIEMDTWLCWQLHRRIYWWLSDRPLLTQSYCCPALSHCYDLTIFSFWSDGYLASSIQLAGGKFPGILLPTRPHYKGTAWLDVSLVSRNPWLKTNRVATWNQMPCPGMLFLLLPFIWIPT